MRKIISHFAAINLIVAFIISCNQNQLAKSSISAIDNKIDSLLIECLQSYKNLAHKIKLKRNYLLEKFSPESNAEAWKILLKDTIKNS